MAEEAIPTRWVEELRRQQCARWQAGDRIPAEVLLQQHPKGVARGKGQPALPLLPEVLAGPAPVE